MSAPPAGPVTHRVLAGRAAHLWNRPRAQDVPVRGNEVVGGSHFFRGAISVGVQASDARCRVEANRGHGFRSTGELVGGPGIRLTTTFASPGARPLRISGTTVGTPGEDAIALVQGEERTGMTDGRATVELDPNRSAGSTALTEAALRARLGLDGALRTATAEPRETPPP